MSLVLPDYITFAKGDFKGIFSGYFLVTDTYSKIPVVGSQVLSKLQYAVNKISVYSKDEFDQYIKDQLGLYGIDSSDFAKYVKANKGKILYAVGDYQTVIDLVQEYNNYYRIIQGHSVGEFIDWMYNKASSGVGTVFQDLASGLSKVLVKLLPVIIIIIVVFLVGVYGISKVNKSKG